MHLFLPLNKIILITKYRLKPIYAVILLNQTEVFFKSEVQSIYINDKCRAAFQLLHEMHSGWNLDKISAFFSYLCALCWYLLLKLLSFEWYAILKICPHFFHPPGALIYKCSICDLNLLKPQLITKIKYSFQPIRQS